MSKKDKTNMPRVHPDLQGLNVEVDSFGKIKANYDLDKLNEFLNKNVDDKKLKERKPDKDADEA